MMVKKAKHTSTETEEYELLPHREIEDLKEELRKLKEFEITPTKKLRISLLELNTKLDKLLKIFDEARHEIRSEEIGLGFKEKMKPLVEKMDKMLEQQADIAEGMVALADIVKGKEEEKPEIKPTPSMPPGMPPRPMAPSSQRTPPAGPPRQGMPPPMPPPPSVPPAGAPRPAMPPPTPPRKKRFGIL
jgi:hypothetical protein